MDDYAITPIGTIERKQGITEIVIDESYTDGMLGLDGYSHINVLYWLHENDTAAGRGVLQVHPRRDPKNPLTGVFATHSPVRPNPIALTRCKVLAIDGLRIRIEEIDARDGSPVIDIKCYIPHDDADADILVPDWV